MCVFFESFIYDSSSRVADSGSVNKSIFNIEMEPFSLWYSKQFPLLHVLDVAIYGYHVWHKRSGHKKQFPPSFYQTLLILQVKIRVISQDWHVCHIRGCML